jgi:hypothetical protein
MLLMPPHYSEREQARLLQAALRLRLLRARAPL